ncbi:UNVERIFIED_CONTAM: hypothetical protein K2H54_049371 [Gekko kuhli]
MSEFLLPFFKRCVSPSRETCKSSAPSTQGCFLRKGWVIGAPCATCAKQFSPSPLLIKSFCISLLPHFLCGLYLTESLCKYHVMFQSFAVALNVCNLLFHV